MTFNPNNNIVAQGREGKILVWFIAWCFVVVVAMVSLLCRCLLVLYFLSIALAM
jgi:hypothetical protein